MYSCGWWRWQGDDSMLSPEAARERLESFHDPHQVRNTLVRLSLLHGDLPGLGQLLIHAGPAWERAQKGRPFNFRGQADALERLADLKARDRQALFRALLPKIADQVEAAWTLFDRLPYQTGYNRRPFRNPDRNPFAARANWVQRLVYAVGQYTGQDVKWLAEWAPYLGYQSDALGYLFAGAIEQGGKTGQEIFDILIASAGGRHETGAMGRHVVRGLLCCSRPDGWEFVEKMLLAAQREEGLRQVILEGIDESQPDAFRRMLRLILENNLSRFSSAIRAFDVWFGVQMENAPQKRMNGILAQVLEFLDAPASCEKAIREGGAEQAYYALWAMAYRNAQAALPHAIELRHSSDPARRLAATHLLAQMSLAGGFQELLEALDDADLHMPARALTGLTRWGYGLDRLAGSDMFDRLERLLVRIPDKQTTLKPLVWEWFRLVLDREMAAGQLVECLGQRSPKRLIPHLAMMNPFHRAAVVRLLEETREKDAETLGILLKLVGDASSTVREAALKSLNGFHLGEAEIGQLEGLLKRKAEDLRRGIIQLFLDLPDRSLFQSVDRLLGQKSENQHLAALELLRECKQEGRGSREVVHRARLFREHTQPTAAEQRLLEGILAEDLNELTLQDALGLMDPNHRTRPEPVRPNRFRFGLHGGAGLSSQAAVACLRSLDELVELHRNDEIEVERGDAKVKELLGNFHPFWRFTRRNLGLPPEEDWAARMPLQEVWEEWWQSRPAALRDQDGFELIRVLALISLFQFNWMRSARSLGEVSPELQKFIGSRLDLKLRYKAVVQTVVEWLIKNHPQAGEADFILEALEESFRRIPEKELKGVAESYGVRQRQVSHQKSAYLTIARWHRQLRPDSWQSSQNARLWKVVRWLDQPAANLPRIFPQVEDVLYALEAGAATRDDLLDLVIGPREDNPYGNRFPELKQFSGRQPHPAFQRFPILRELIEACRQRIIEVETQRGDLPTAASRPASFLQTVPGLENLIRLLKAMGKTDFERGYRYSGGLSRSAVLSRLIRNSYPLEADSAERFAREVHALRIPERKLVELAVFAPQWAPFVEQTLGWSQLSEAVWWVYAHTKDRQWRVEADIRAEWAVRISEYTPLSPDSLMDGAVDVAWFHRFYPGLGDAHWQEIYRAAEYAAGGLGHTRARLFADAMLGKLPPDDCIQRLNQKRHQDSVRALGLIPLPDSKGAKAEILRRYEAMKEFQRTGKKFGSMRQASEKLAVSIGMENLARTAGYPDPQRLEWAMESESVADLAGGPVVVTEGEVRVTLVINDLGEPEVEISKKDKPIKTLPAAVKKAPCIAALFERKQKLNRQIHRMRSSLEQAMCRGDRFSPSELQALFRHPMLRAMIEQLVFVSPSGMGYPMEGGRVLLHHDGKPVPLRKEDPLRIAHPLDLLESKEWDLWQHECFIAERIQPFKQVFRELYVLTSNERGEGNLSRRYAGQQVNPRQAVALFGGRGWVTDPEEGVQKTFHEAGLSARVGFLNGAFTPAEMEGLTLEAVLFTRRGDWQPLSLESIPARIFSEVMRDLDLVVSVAHAGGIDPEASSSSVESRAALLRESCGLLQLTNVQLGSTHAMVHGKLGNYNVHLGSGVIHKQPGGALCIIPVHSQQRGRLFLPFVDDDPKTAEIVSKVLLLARDDQIKDPTILEQILSS